MINEHEVNTMNKNNILYDFDSQIMLWKRHGYQGQELITIRRKAVQSGIIEIYEFVDQFFRIIPFKKNDQVRYIFNRERCASVLDIKGNILNQIFF
jgi:hypothetical protein